MHFGKGKSRFDDPVNKYGVLSAAMLAEGAFADKVKSTVELMTAAWRAWVAQQIDKYKLNLLPA